LVVDDEEVSVVSTCETVLIITGLIVLISVKVKPSINRTFPRSVPKANIKPYNVLLWKSQHNIDWLDKLVVYFVRNLRSPIDKD